MLLDEGPDVAPGDLHAVHLQDVPPERAALDEAVPAEGAHVGLLACVGHPVVSVR